MKHLKYMLSDQYFYYFKNAFRGYIVHKYAFTVYYSIIRQGLILLYFFFLPEVKYRTVRLLCRNVSGID